MSQRGDNKLTIKCAGCAVKRTQKVLRESIEWLRETMTKKWNTRAHPPDSGGVREALQSLVNEVSGFLSNYRLDMREAAGNTNVAVLEDRLANARAALSRPSHCTERREEIAIWLLRDRGMETASIDAIKEYRGETWLKALCDADDLLSLLALTEQNSGPTAGRDGRPAYLSCPTCGDVWCLKPGHMYPSPSAEPVAWRYIFNGDPVYVTKRMTAAQSKLTTDETPLYAFPVSDASREALIQIRKYCDENLGPSRSSLLNKIAALADAALSPSFDKTGSGK